MANEVTIQLPAEFVDLCQRDGTTPETVLRGFIADLCGLESLVSDPRADGYNSHGSDERDLAGRYYDRANYNRRDFEAQPPAR